MFIYFCKKPILTSIRRAYNNSLQQERVCKQIFERRAYNNSVQQNQYQQVNKHNFEIFQWYCYIDVIYKLYLINIF